MLEQNTEYFWSDKWSVEDDTAWFVGGELNVLFSMNMLTNYYKIVASLPGPLNVFRKNSNCIKCGNSVFCMPDYGDCIWCYDLSSAKIKEIELVNHNHAEGIGIGDFWRCGGILWAVSTGLKQILEIDIEKKRVVGYHNITEKKDETLSQSTKAGNYIYTVCSSKSIIYEFNIEKKEIRRHKFNEINDSLRTISISRGKIWLSGRKRKIYMWLQKKEELEILEHFPEDFGIYSFDKTGKLFLDTKVEEYNLCTFINSIDAGDYIWFIPFQTNHILYVNKDTNEIKTLRVEEDESVEKVKGDGKYIFQYVNQDRYIGLYSTKNKAVIEIDAFSMEVKVRDIRIVIDETEKISDRWIFRESFGAERKLYEKLIERNSEKVSRKEMAGEKIYTYVK